MITIIIPLKNNRDHIIDTLTSVKSQTFQKWSCIIVDDGSTDGSFQLVKNFIVNDCRFVLLVSDSNGANACRNIGLNYSSTDYVIFLDADDQLKQNCLEIRLNFLNNHKSYDFIISQTEIYCESVNQPEGYFRSNYREIDHLILAFVEHKIQWNTTGVTWRKKFLVKIKEWNEKYPRLQDVELNIRALLSYPKIGFLPIVDSIYYASPFTETKKYFAQFGFVYLTKEYYPIIKERYKNNPVLLKSFQKAFSKSIHSVESYCRLRNNGYNPSLQILLMSLVKIYPELVNTTLYKESLSNLNYDIDTISTLENFIDHWALIKQKEVKVQLDLRSGLGGDLLFLFYYLNSRQNQLKVHTLRQQSKLLLQEIKYTRYLREKFSFWNGTVGLIHLFETLNKNGFVEIDLMMSYSQYNETSLEFLSRSYKFDKDAILTSLAIYSRLKNMPQKENMICQAEIVLIKIAEYIIRLFDNSYINIYTIDYSIEIGFLTHLLAEKLYLEPINRILEKFEKILLADINKYPVTLEAVNNIFILLNVYNKGEYGSDKNKKLLNESLLRIPYDKIYISPAPYFKITLEYLIFLNNLIKYNQKLCVSQVNQFVEDRLMHDMSFVSETNATFQKTYGGIIGASGVALTIISYLHPELPSWDNILIIN
jgi:Glycosyltransferases involved in cell wall biogenesis